jgi:alpha-glucosidase
MRPVFLEYPEDEHFYTEQDTAFLTEYLFGRDLLIAPRVTEMLDPLEIDLPPGSWYDYWTGEKFPGGTDIKVTPPLDSLPVYVRGGAILPQQPIVQYTAQKPDGPLQLQVYPGESCEGSLYLDDGISFAYQQGDYLRINFTCEQSPGGVKVKIAQPEGRFSPWWNQVSVQVYGVDARPTEVLAGGNPVSDWKFDAATHSVSATIANPTHGTEIVISYPAH